MSEPKKYSSPGAFRNAFRKKVPLRMQKIRIMQRFALRICQHAPDSVVKGGLALELRFSQARTTKDIDVVMSADAGTTLAVLQAAALHDLGDFLQFDVSAEPRGAMIDRPRMAYAGARYVVKARFGPRPVPEAKFAVDVTYGAVAVWDELTAEMPEFPDTPSGKLRVLPASKQIAEKVHAYADPTIREDPKQLRVRDLADICFFASRDAHDGRKLRADLVHTFEQRKESARSAHGIELHDLPSTLPPPPASWTVPFAEFVRRDSLPWPEVSAAYRLAGSFLDPVLQDPAFDLHWSPSEATWRPK